MTVFQSIAEILICFFAVLGLYFTVSHIFDCITARNAPSRTLLYIEECAEENLEYLIRFYESRIVNGDFKGMVCGILLPRDCPMNDDITEKLCNEFENIYFV